MAKLFGTDGIRGITNTELTPELALKIGKAIGTYFGKGSRLLVGRDVRAGGDMILRSVESGLLSSGVIVYEGGMAPTPAFQYGVKTLGYDGGVVITASHNPPQYNGIKVLSPNGIEISRE
ncbi:MAG: phosphoglucosamine mutase, partial [Saccharolobus sp.]